MDYKEETIRAYDTYPERFNDNFGNHFEQYAKKSADEFLGLLKGKRILDLGSGPGNHAAYFQEKGYDVLCLHVSDEMLKLCAKKGLRTIKMDIEALDFPTESFDGIWAYASLLHVPKSRIKGIGDMLHAMLRSGGVLAIAVKEGISDGFEQHEKYPGTRRWFTNFEDAEIRKLFVEKFSILSFSREQFRTFSFIKYMMRKS